MRWELAECLRNPALWGPLLFLVAYSAGPGYDDSLYFFYINRRAPGGSNMGLGARFEAKKGLSRCGTRSNRP